MDSNNLNYLYGKGIIWMTYRHLLYEERRKYVEKKEMMKELGRRLLGGEDDSFQAAEFVDVFNRLPDDIRKLLYMRYVYGLTVNELAEAYGISPSAMSHRMAKCKIAFRKAWEGREND